MKKFEQLLAEFQIINPQNIHLQTVPSECTTQAFAQTQEQFSEIYSVIELGGPSNQNCPTLQDITETMDAVLAGNANAWEHFERLETQSKHFSLQIAKKNPKIILVSSIHPLRVLNAEHVLLSSEQIAILEINDSDIQIITTQRQALTIFFESENEFQTYELELPPIPRFQTKQPTWLIPFLTKQDLLIEKAIAFGDLSRFEELASKEWKKEDFLKHLEISTRSFQWQDIHPIQKSVLYQHIFHWIKDLTERSQNLLSTEDIEANFLLWCQERDQLQSLLCTVPSHPNPTELQAQLDDLDRSFPHEKTAHILPSNHRLAEAYAKDPSSWWGKSSKMRELYDQISEPQS